MQVCKGVAEASAAGDMDSDMGAWSQAQAQSLLATHQALHGHSLQVSPLSCAASVQTQLSQAIELAAYIALSSRLFLRLASAISCVLRYIILCLTHTTSNTMCPFMEYKTPPPRCKLVWDRRVDGHSILLSKTGNPEAGLDTDALFAKMSFLDSTHDSFKLQMWHKEHVILNNGSHCLQFCPQCCIGFGLAGSAREVDAISSQALQQL